MSTLADLLADPSAWTDRDALVASALDDLGVDAAVAATIAEALAGAERGRAERAACDERRLRAAEINDDVVQGITAAAYALELDDPAKAGRYLRHTLLAANQLMTQLTGPTQAHDEPDRVGRSHPTDDAKPDCVLPLLRSSAADLSTRRAV